MNEQSKENKKILNNTEKPLSIALLTQLIFECGVECKDEEIADKLFNIVTMIDERGIE